MSYKWKSRYLGTIKRLRKHPGNITCFAGLSVAFNAILTLCIKSKNYKWALACRVTNCRFHGYEVVKIILHLQFRVMKNASQIIALSSLFGCPQHSPEEVSNKAHWNGNRPATGIEKSAEISSAGLERLLFSSAFSELTGTLEIIFFHSDPVTIDCIHIPVKACFLFTFIKGTTENTSLSWTSSLS